MTSQNPYASYLGNEDPLRLLAETPRRLTALVARFGAEGFSRSYAPGKWDAREILMHLAHMDLVFGVRLRMALASDQYVVQPFDQDAWMAIEPRVDGSLAFETCCTLREWNLPLFRSLTPADLNKTFQHPERGAVTPRWILELLAGHDQHHLIQLEAIADAGEPRAKSSSV